MPKQPPMPEFSQPVELPLSLEPGPLTRTLRQQIETAVTEFVPLDKSGAVIGVATNDGMRVAVAHRVGTHWKLGGEVGKKWGGKTSGKLFVLGAW